MISLLTPTRNRPVECQRMIESARRTASNPVEIICYISDDDDSYVHTGLDAYIVRGPRLIFSDLWNALLTYATGDIYMQCADDVIFRTPGWDVAIEKAFEEFPDRIMLAFADDGGPNGKTFASLPFVSREWVDAVGYFTGPGFVADFSDAWPYEVAVMIGRARYVDVLIEHAHHLWGKAPMDRTYEENLERYREHRPDLLYQQTAHLRQADAEKLRKVIG
jgi:hypothetical protein